MMDLLGTRIQWLQAIAEAKYWSTLSEIAIKPSEIYSITIDTYYVAYTYSTYIYTPYYIDTEKYPKSVTMY